jgi:hypothetical protein
MWIDLVDSEQRCALRRDDKFVKIGCQTVESRDLAYFLVAGIELDMLARS